MKTYTFKIKLHYASENHPITLSVVHCPLEVLFDSLKEVKQFQEIYKTVKDQSNKEVPSMYVTASDYVNNNGDYVFEDHIFCEYNAILESNSLTELLTHIDYYGFVDVDFSIRKTEQQIIQERYSLIKEGGEDEI